MNNFLIGIILVIFIVMNILYINNFGIVFSPNNGDWGAYGDYIGGILNPLIAFSVFWYVIKSFQSQQTFFKKQEFENNFFRLLDEYKNSKNDFSIDTVYQELSNQISEDNIVDIENYKENILSKSVFPHKHLKYIKVIIEHVDNSALPDIDKRHYIEIFKLQLSNYDLIFIALCDKINNSNLNPILKKYNLFENCSFKEDNYLKFVFLLNDYPLLQKAIEKSAFS